MGRRREDVINYFIQVESVCSFPEISNPGPEFHAFECTKNEQ